MSKLSDRRHVHLDPVGGIAGDMFVAAMLDLFPHSLDRCVQDLNASGVLTHVTVNVQNGHSHGLAVKRFLVDHKTDNPRATGHYRDLQQWLEQSDLDEPVCRTAQSLLKLLASAESKVHGVDIDDVHFHEVADWDSIADIVAAASLIERNAIESWSCASLPTGSGLVQTEHGSLPLPAPATLVLLEGLSTWDDGVPGERVTPTGAAIVKYLSRLRTSNATNNKHGFNRRPRAIGVSSGMGAGQRDLPDRPNVLRSGLFHVTEQNESHDLTSSPVLTLDTPDFDHDVDHVAQLNFAIDDMSSEELAVALQYIRQSDGVIDVTHFTSFGKKGRMMFEVIVLCEPQSEPVVSRLCFCETSTLGMRVQLLARRVLRRRALQAVDDDGSASVKLVDRPLPAGSRQRTMKVESDDLRRIAGLYQRRERAAQITLASIDDTTEKGLSHD